MTRAAISEEAQLEEFTYQTQEATVTEVHISFPEYAGGEARTWFIGAGSSKTNPEDEFDQYLGHRLALARALQDVAAEILSDYFGARKKRK
jgi:hypothetical protein